MARKSLTEGEVHSAADTILATGVSPTVLNLYSFIGRGSYSTIGKYLKSWEELRSSTGADIGQDIEVELPSTAEAELISFAKRLWLQARQIEREDLEHERQALTKREESIETEIQKVVNRSERVSENAERLEGQLEDAREELRIEVASRQQSEQNLALQAADLKRTQAELNKLAEKLESLTDKYEGKVEEVARLNSEVTRLNSDAERLAGKLVQKRQAIEISNQKQANAEFSLKEEKGKNEALANQVRQLQQEKDEGVLVLQQAEDRARSLSEKNATLTGQLMERESQTIKLEQQLDEYLKKIEKLKSDLLISTLRHKTEEDKSEQISKSKHP